MQDKIPDALIDAFERHYAFPWDEPTLRNERLAWRAAWAEATKPCLLKIQEPATPQAAPAAVAVPDDRAAFERELIDNHHYVPSDFSFKDGFYGGDDDYIQFGWDVWKARTALAATPAAAAPVVLPEPVAWRHSRTYDLHDTEDEVQLADGDEHAQPLFTEQQVRAMLAGVSAPAAQAVEHAPVLYVSKGQLDNFRDPDGPDSTAHGRYLPARVTPSGKFTTPLFAAPQAQADARDAGITWPKARDVGRFDDMSPGDSIRVGLDSDNDVYVSVCGGGGVGSVEFCNPGGGGGGKSSRTRLALLALMVAMEADNANDPARDWWARRNTKAAQQGGDKQ